jgi:hypothetical protein
MDSGPNWTDIAQVIILVAQLAILAIAAIVAWHRRSTYPGAAAGRASMVAAVQAVNVLQTPIVSYLFVRSVDPPPEVRPGRNQAHHAGVRHSDR